MFWGEERIPYLTFTTFVLLGLHLLSFSCVRSPQKFPEVPHPRPSLRSKPCVLTRGDSHLKHLECDRPRALVAQSGKEVLQLLAMGLRAKWQRFVRAASFSFLAFALRFLLHVNRG